MADTRLVLAAYAHVLPSVPPPHTVKWMNKLMKMAFEGGEYNEKGQLVVSDKLIVESDKEWLLERSIEPDLRFHTFLISF